jgi:hypothetical protein
VNEEAQAHLGGVAPKQTNKLASRTSYIVWCFKVNKINTKQIINKTGFGDRIGT